LAIIGAATTSQPWNPELPPGNSALCAVLQFCGDQKTAGHLTFSLQEGLAGRPDYVFWNGPAASRIC
jgi:hypothetical protein